MSPRALPEGRRQADVRAAAWPANTLRLVRRRGGGTRLDFSVGTLVVIRDIKRGSVLRGQQACGAVQRGLRVGAALGDAQEGEHRLRTRRPGGATTSCRTLRPW